MEWNFILDMNQNLATLCNKNGCRYSNVVITNGFYLPDEVIERANEQKFKYIQITLDGSKNYHNSRRNISNFVDSYSQILENVSRLLRAGVEIVIRINLDKKNSSMISSFLVELRRFFPKTGIGQKLYVSFGRIFGSEDSYTLREYEDIYQELYQKAALFDLVVPTLDVSLLTAFCSAETLNDNIVMDYLGNVYHCWNDIFDQDQCIANVYDSNFKREKTMKPGKYLNELSLEKVNEGKCIDCEWINFCQGFCPYDRLQVASGKSENIYLDEQCKKIVKKRLETQISALLLYEGAHHEEK